MSTSVSSFSVKLPVMAAAVALAGFGWAGRANAAVYAGNGGTGFGGPVGQGSLTVTDDGVGDITFAFTPSATHASLDGNNLVLYIGTGSTGLADTSSLVDTGTPAGSDNGHTAISGYNNFSQTPASRSVIAFPSAFGSGAGASYAISFANVYDGLFKLPTDGSGELAYIDGKAPVANVNTLTVPLAELGLTQGQSLSFVGTDIDGSAAYRSNEAIGAATLSTNPGPDLSTDGNPGYNNLITFTSFDTYTTTAVPEPASVGVLTVGAALAFKRRRNG